MTTYAQLTLQCFFLLQLVVNVFGVLLQRFRESLKVSLVLMWTSICTTIKWSTQHTFNLLEPSKSQQLVCSHYCISSHFFWLFPLHDCDLECYWKLVPLQPEIGVFFSLIVLQSLDNVENPFIHSPPVLKWVFFFPLILPYSYTISGFIGSYNKSIQSDTQVLEQ